MSSGPSEDYGELDFLVKLPFDPTNPTPLSSAGREAVERAKESGTLDLSLQSLSNMPVQIFSLENLKYVNLSVNQLRFIPESLCTLISMTHLDLSSNQLDAIPSHFGRLTNLTSLNLRHNSICELPQEFNDLKALAKVNFEYNWLNVMPNLIAMSAMQEMKIKSNRIKSIGKINFSGPDGVFDFQGNEISRLDDLSGFSHAVELQFSDNCLESIRSFAGLSKLSKLFLCSNRLAHLPSDIYNMRVLTELDLRENELQSLPDEIGLLQSLHKLTICSNRLVSIPAHIFQLTELQMLNLSGNMVSDHGLPPGIDQLTNLKELYLGGNLLSHVPARLYHLPALLILNLSWNRLGSFDPPSSTLSRLTHLFLTGNRLSVLSEAVCDLRCLKELHVGANALALLPEGLGGLKGLEQMDVRANRLKALPLSLKHLSFLERIDAMDNPGMVVPSELLDKKMLHVVTEVEDHSAASSAPASAAGNSAVPVKGRFEAAVADMKGRRWSMEDAVTLLGAFRGRADEAYWGVFDGHGGDRASALACVRHPQLFAERLQSLEAELSGKSNSSQSAHPSGPQAHGPVKLDAGVVLQALKDTFVATSLEMTMDTIKRSGSTAVVCVALGDMLYVADVGDSRAVLFAGGKARRVSLDHKPDLPAEEERIRRLGGFVSPNGRVVGMLAVSRAFGDVELQPYVTAEPYVMAYSLVQPKADFLIMACDGVWDVISDERACEIVASETSIERGAMKLRDYAYFCGSSDNISVVVVNLKN